MLKILQARFQQVLNCEIPDVQAGFRKGKGTRDQIANIHWIIEQAWAPAFGVLTIRPPGKSQGLSFLIWKMGLRFFITFQFWRLRRRGEHGKQTISREPGSRMWEPAKCTGLLYPWGPGSQNWPTSQSPNSAGPRAAGRARAGGQDTWLLFLIFFLVFPFDFCSWLCCWLVTWSFIPLNLHFLIC